MKRIIALLISATILFIVFTIKPTDSFEQALSVPETTIPSIVIIPEPLEIAATEPAQTTVITTTAETTITPPTTTPPLSTTPPPATTKPPATTTPPATATPSPEQLTPASTTFINGQKYQWDPVLGWIKNSGDGHVTIMDVVSDGYKFYEEPDGRVNLGKLVAPNGEIVTYEQWKGLPEKAPRNAERTLPPIDDDMPVVIVDMQEYREPSLSVEE